MRLALILFVILPVFHSAPVKKVLLSYSLSLPLPDMVGVLCGATTNTPALGAAQQTLKQMGEPDSTAALGAAVAYPLGVVGVILAILVIRKLLARPDDLKEKEPESMNSPYVAAFQVHNPGVFHKTLKDLGLLSHTRFVVSRLWRDGKVTIPTGTTELQENDRLLVITTEKEMPTLTLLFGEQENRDWNKEDIDWNSIDRNLVSEHIVVTRPEINGKRLGALHLRNLYDINISRVLRSGVQILATPDLILQLGDRLTVIGEKEAINRVAGILGNSASTLREPNLAAIFIGIVLGLVLGSVPLSLPGISTPVKMGLAGGPIIMGILVGNFGPRLHMRIYTTRSANLMLRGIGLSLYLAGIGIDAGAHFFETVVRPEGILWIGSGFLITVVPILLMAVIAMRACKMNFGTTCGMLCGSMANPMALNYLNDSYPGNDASVSYATVYPLGMFVRVILSQVVLMMFL